MINQPKFQPNEAIEKVLDHSFKDKWYAYFADAWEIRRRHFTIAARLIWQRSQVLMRPSFERSSSQHQYKKLQQEVLLQYFDGLYEYAKILTCNDADAEALVRKSILLAAKTPGQMRPNSDLQLWLFTIVREAFRKKARNTGKKYGREERSYESITFYATRDRSTDIRNAIGLLPEEDRELIVLRDFQAFSYQQIGRLLNRPTEMVASSLSQARNRLNQLLASQNAQPI
jgi:RNA polymerase sigma-70 factor, ECF subfamily